LNPRQSRSIVRKLTGNGGTVVFWISPVILYTFKGIVIKV